MSTAGSLSSVTIWDGGGGHEDRRRGGRDVAERDTHGSHGLHEGLDDRGIPIHDVLGDGGLGVPSGLRVDEVGLEEDGGPVGVEDVVLS